MGRKSEVVTKTFTSPMNEKITKEVELFTWEKLDKINEIKAEFSL
jgi:S-adenosylmethionine synthetase